jgi:hypothetical protein
MLPVAEMLAGRHPDISTAHRTSGKPFSLHSTESKQAVCQLKLFCFGTPEPRKHKAFDDVKKSD